MRVTAFDPYVPADSSAWSQLWGPVEARPLDALLSESDVVSLHVPLTPETRNLIDAAALARMRNDAILINAARGGVVDEAALAGALRNGRLGGAALDVFAAEPVDADRGSVFAECPNLVLTPHIAGVTEESNVRVSWVTVEAVRKHLSGV
jgi:(S)-sulfolactate dehydrogenase